MFSTTAFSAHSGHSERLDTVTTVRWHRLHMGRDSSSAALRCFPERPFGSTFRAAATNSSNSSGVGSDRGPLSPTTPVYDVREIPAGCYNLQRARHRSSRGALEDWTRHRRLPRPRWSTRRAPGGAPPDRGKVRPLRGPGPLKGPGAAHLLMTWTPPGRRPGGPGTPPGLREPCSPGRPRTRP